MNVDTSSYISQILSRYKNSQSETAKTGKEAFSLTLEVDAEISVEEQPAQTLEEFKAAFYKELDSMWIHPSQLSAYHSVSITDGGFEKLMADPAKTQEILDDIRKDRARNNSVANSAFIHSSWDDDLKYSGASGGSAHMGKYEAMSAGAFYKSEPTVPHSSTRSSSTAKNSSRKTKAQKRKEENDKFLEELLEKRAAEKKELNSRMYASPYFNSQYISSYSSKITSSAASFFDSSFFA